MLGRCCYDKTANSTFHITSSQNNIYRSIFISRHGLTIGHGEIIYCRNGNSNRAGVAGCPQLILRRKSKTIHIRPLYISIRGIGNLLIVDHYHSFSSRAGLYCQRIPIFTIRISHADIKGNRSRFRSAGFFTKNSGSAINIINGNHKGGRDSMISITHAQRNFKRADSCRMAHKSK